MTPELTNLLLVIGVFCAAIGLVAQGVAALGMFRAVSRLKESLEPVLPKAQAAFESTVATMLKAQKTFEEMRETLGEAKQQIGILGEQSSKVLNNAKAQLDHFNSTREEATNRFRAQAERLELVIDDTLGRFQDVVQSMHRGVMQIGRAHV